MAERGPALPIKGNIMRKRCLLTLGATFLLAAGASLAPAMADEPYPSRSIQLIVPYAPGGALDTLARLVSKGLSQTLGQAVVVENKPGAANIIGNAYVAHAAPDGYTLLFAGAPLALNQALDMKQPYDALKDFAPISLVATTPMLVAVSPSSKYHSLAEILADAKASSAGIAYATAGVGSMPNLAGEALRMESGSKLTHVGYRGSAPALTDAMGGSVPVIIDAYTPTGTAVAEGKMRGIVVASKHRSPSLPDVPTTAEAGFPNITGEGFYGVLAPAKTPEPIVQKLHDTIVKVTDDSALRDRLLHLGYEVTATTPEAYAAYLREEIQRWTPVVKAAGIHP